MIKPKRIRACCMQLLVALMFCPATIAQQITNIETSSNNVWVVHLETDWIDIKETNRPTVYNDLKPSITGWTVNGIAPNDIGIYSNVIDEKKAISISNENYFPIKMKHRIYLIMNSDLIENQAYVILSPYGDTTIAFQQNTVYCESIKVN
ncbi:MAG TPA: hypothetical protein EYN69_01215, partial [Flavobacteriales bacterium]|nr:hypothetical protein [Flavobacteriales bacterium]